MEGTQFNNVLEGRLNDLIRREFASPVLDPPTLVRIRDRFRDVVRSVCMTTGNAMSDEAMCWIANQVYQRVELGDGETLASKVIINEFDLGAMGEADVRLMHELFMGTPLAPALRSELDRRSS